LIASLVTLLSLNLTANLLSAGTVAYTYPITAASVTTPIQITCPNHGIPPQRVAHGVVSGATGMIEANGLWEASYVDPNTLSLASYSAQGVSSPSVGANPYTGGGSFYVAFPDWQILLGRRWIAAATAVASPRVVFVPTMGRAWDLEPYGGVGGVGQLPAIRGTAEQQAEKLLPQLATEFATFEVYVTGSAPTPDPDYGDFEATQALTQALYVVMFDAAGPSRAKVLREEWPSQSIEAGSQTQRGQQMRLIVEFQIPVVREPLKYVPVGTFIQESVTPYGGTAGDVTIITISPATS
jgi:hypothetical protein